ncbi:MAG: trypsin-like serine protease [candidate division Zixibacteria bacterium]|nr:trypsin-like serine protease [candidate division Zixibacteria bacterium]
MCFRRAFKTLTVVAAFLFSTNGNAQLPPFDETAVVKIYAYYGIKSIREVESEPRLKDSDYYIGSPQYAYGSGIIIDSRGLILTAKHVSEGAKFLTVKIPGNTLSYPAVTLFEDNEYDFSVIYIRGAFSNYKRLPDSAVGITTGMAVWAYGYPELAGEKNPTITSGHITNKSSITGYWQMDAAINPGNSGGPLIDNYGNIAGIVVGQLNGSQLMNYALPIETILPTMRNLISTGQLDQPMREFQNQPWKLRQVSEFFSKTLSRFFEKDNYFTIDFASDFEDFMKNHAIDEYKTQEFANCLAISAVGVWNEAVAKAIKSDRIKIVDATTDDLYSFAIAGTLMKAAVGIDQSLEGIKVVEQMLTVVKIIEEFSETLPDIIVVSPIKGDRWKSGETGWIEWHPDKEVGSVRVMLDYSTNDGRDWNTILNYNSLESDWIRDVDNYRYGWNIPQSINSRQCLVRVTIANSKGKIKYAQSESFRIQR